MQHYELLCVLRGTLSEDELLPVLQKIEETIVSQEGKMSAKHDMGKRRIAYPMKHIRYGYFHLALFDATPSVVPSIQEKLRLMPELLRCVIRVYNPKVDEGKGVMLGQVIDEITRRDDMERPERKESSSKRHHSTQPQEESMQQGAAASLEPEAVEKESAVSMEDIDKKLDELLQSDLDKV